MSGAITTQQAGQDFWDPSGISTEIPGAISSWNKLLLGGEALPGLAWVTAQRKQKTDVKTTAGGDGSTQTNSGTEPAIVNVRLEIWTPDHWTQWQRWIPRLEPRPGKPRKDAIQAYHPALAAHRINALWLKHVGLAEATNKHGVFEIKIAFNEWKPVVSAGGVATVLKATGNTVFTGGAEKYPLKPSETENRPFYLWGTTH